MKFTKEGASFATFELALDLAANQRVMNRLILQYFSGGDQKEFEASVKILNQEVNTELALLRSRAFRFAEISLDDLLNGIVDI